MLPTLLQQFVEVSGVGSIEQTALIFVSILRPPLLARAEIHLND